LEEDIQIFNNLEQIQSYEEFEQKYENIYRIFRAKCLGKDTNIELKEKFNNFKKKIINVPDNKIEEFNKKIDKINDIINGGLRNFQPIAC
jgi:hypothetical protein